MDQRTICSYSECLICKSNSYVDQIIMCRLENYLQNEELSAYQKIICTSKNYLQIENQSADQITFCRMKNYLQNEELSAD